MCGFLGARRGLVLQRDPANQCKSNIEEKLPLGNNDIHLLKSSVFAEFDSRNRLADR